MQILIAEDDFIARSLLQNMLETLGHTVFVAEDGEAAWALFQKEIPPLLITDWVMPGMNGLELIQKIRSTSGSEYVFIILLTSKDSKANIIEGLESGADDYLSKPFDQAELIARIKSGVRILELQASLQRAYQEAKNLAVTDTLTGAHNKRYLNDNFNDEIKRSQRYQHPISIIMCDLDHFKNTNDTYGHLAGDRVLKVFVERISKEIRSGLDWIIRYGGEEFLIVLPETDLAGAVKLAERLRQVVATRAILFGEHQIQVTASFGVSGVASGLEEDENLSECLIHAADNHLYQAKQNGRNQVCGGIVTTPC